MYFRALFLEVFDYSFVGLSRFPSCVTFSPNSSPCFNYPNNIRRVKTINLLVM